MIITKTKKFLISLLIIPSIAAIQTTALAGASQVSYDFEASNQGWFFTGGAGLDYGVGLAHRGIGNGWVRNTSGWNAVNVRVPVNPYPEYGYDCVASAWLRTSSSLTDGYMTVRSDQSSTGRDNIIEEIKLVGAGIPNPEHKNYNQYSFRFNPGKVRNVLFYVGLWGNGQDSWIQVDDVAITCFSPY